MKIFIGLSAVAVMLFSLMGCDDHSRHHRHHDQDRGIHVDIR